jgi:hypothetical protein
MDMDTITAVKTEAEIDKLKAEVQLLRAQHGKVTREIFWYPMVTAVALIATISGVTIAVLKLFGH